MRIIEIEPLQNGGHRNFTTDGELHLDGYAIIPDDLETPSFPFGDIEVEEIDGVMTVTKWIEGKIPEPEPEIEAEPTVNELLDILLGVADDE